MRPGFYLFLGWGVGPLGPHADEPPRVAVRIDRVHRENRGVVTFTGAELARSATGWRVVRTTNHRFPAYCFVADLVRMEPPR